MMDLCDSYCIKHRCQQAIGEYVSNADIKAQMIRAGHEATYKGRDVVNAWYRVCFRRGYKYRVMTDGELRSEYHRLKTGHYPIRPRQPLKPKVYRRKAYTPR